MRETLKQSKFHRILFGEFHRNLKISDFDIGIFFTVTFLSLFGVVMIASVTIPLTDGSLSMTLNHIVKLILAIFIGLLIFRVSLSTWKKIDFSNYFFFFSINFSFFSFYWFRSKWSIQMDQNIRIFFSTIRINEIFINYLHIILLF